MKKQYDIISVSSLFYPMTGGLEIMVYNLLNYLTKKGYKPIAIHGKAEKDTEYVLNNYTVKTFKTRNLFNNTYPIFSFRFFKYTYTLIKGNPNAKVLIHSRHFLSSFLCALACWFLKREYILVEHTAQTSFLKSKIAQKAVNVYEKTLSQFVLKKAQRIISASKASQDYLIKEHNIAKEKITVIYNGFEEKELQSFLKVKKKKKITFATKMIKVKNPKITYEAFKELSEKHKDWDFYFIGSGDFFKGAQTNAKNLKIINKMISRQEVLKLYGMSSIYINSSLSEGLSLAIVEATYLKNIPVLSDAPSNIEIAKGINTQNYIFKKHDVNDLKEKIEKAMKEHENSALREGIHKKVCKTFKNEVLFKEYEDILSA